VNGLERLLRDINRPELIGEGLNGEVAAAIADNYPPTMNGNSASHSAVPDLDEQKLDESWARIDLGPALHGDLEPVMPELLRRDDGKHLLYRGRVNGIHGDSGDGKSWAAAIATAQELDAGHHVAWCDFEDDETVIIERLRLLDAQDDTIEERFHYYRPTAPFDDLAVEAVEADIREHDVVLVVIDSLGEAFGLEGVDEDRDVQVGPWLRRVARRLADSGAAVLLIDHSTKAKDAPLFPSGSKRKRAAITGHSMLLEAIVPLTRENGGRLRLTCAKDRHGQYRRGEHVATLDFHIYPDDDLSVKVWPPLIADENQEAPDEKLRVIARAAIRGAKKAGRPISGRELEALMNVKAAATTKRAGIDYAIGEGAMRVTQGPRRSVLHEYVHDLDDTESQP
jgi:hypothetical protein